LLRPFRDTNPLLWQIRDGIYSGLYYRAPDRPPERRHLAGLWSWTLWAVLKALLISRRPVPPFNPQSRFHFLFCGTHSAHYDTLLPVVREAAVRSPEAPVCAWSVELRPEQEASLAGIGNVSVVRLPGVYSCASRSIKLAAARRALREALALRRALKDTPHGKALRRKASFVAESFFHHLIALDFWNREFPRPASGAVFCTNESFYHAKAFISRARKRNWRAIHFCHGLRHAMHQVTQATDFCVFSEMDRAWFQPKVETGSAVRAIGNPRMEAIRDGASPPRRRNPGEPFRLLFLSSGIESPYTLEMVKADLAILAARPETRAKYLLRVRPHPREVRRILHEVVRELGLKVDEYSWGTLAEDLAWCDAAATPWSTALLEAAVAGRLCYWLDAGGHGFGGTGELQRAGLGLLVRTPEAWAEAVRQCSLLQTGPPAAVSTAKLNELRICLQASPSWWERLQL